jgi:hypothetical protein
MPPISALFVTNVNAITYRPLAFAGAVNCWTLAIFFPPAAVKLSKFALEDWIVEPELNH